MRILRKPNLTKCNPTHPSADASLRMQLWNRLRRWQCIGLFFLGLSGQGWTSPLSNCSDHFIDGNPANAPTLFRSAPEEPFDSNVHMCYRTADATFFALEYWPERLLPRWTAYRLSGDSFGPGACKSYKRKTFRCYFFEKNWVEPFECNDRQDPFHPDHLLEGGALNVGAFTNSGHDRGHIVPRQALSWHVCGDYQTFTMANMAPQSAALNGGIWADLENQVLTWAIDHGPIYVVSGTIFRFIPHWRFAVYRDGALDSGQIYEPGSTLETIAIRMHKHAETHPNGHILSPWRDPNLDRLDETGRVLIVPTGFFKVLYRPLQADEPAHAIAFLIPHSFERLRMLTDHYDGLDRKEALWAFVSRIDLIEELSDIRFPGISEKMKSQWGSSWFFERKGARGIRDSSCGIGAPAGVLEGASRAEREASCKPLLR